MLRRASQTFIFFFAIASIFFGYAMQVNGATITITPASGQYTVGQTMTVDFLLSTPQQAANAASVDLKFPQDKMRVTNLSKDSSIISYWVSEPSFSNTTGVVNFEGIIPNPGFQGSNAPLLTISFEILDVGTAPLNITDGSVLANDGNGTEILTNLGTANYTFIAIAATPTPTPTPTPSPAETPTPNPTPTPFQSPDNTPSPTNDPSNQNPTDGPGGDPATDPNNPSPQSDPEGSVDAVMVSVREAIAPVTEFVQSPEGIVVTRTVSTIGVVTTGLVSFSSLFVSSLSLADLLLIPFRLWALLMAALGLKKRYKPWGIVYDSITKQPIDPAIVVLHDSSGNPVQNAVTDMDGRYGFATLEPGTYTLTANKTHYTFPSEVLAGKTYDELYTDLYFGGPIVVDEHHSLIVKNVPLDANGFDWNEFVKKQQGLTKFYSRRDWWVEKLTTWLFRLGFAVTIIATILTYAPYNFVTLGLYILLAILRTTKIGSKVYGHIIEKDTGRPLPFAVVSVFYDAPTEIKIATKVADKRGRYYCLVANGRYLVKIQRKNDDQSYTTVYTSSAFDVTNGIIKNVFEV